MFYKKGANMKFFDLDVVKPLVVKENVPVGTVGTVICVFTRPNEAYMVEFCGERGIPYAEPAYLPEELELVDRPLGYYLDNPDLVPELYA
ncbi:MAG: DUF4926 domain-containing protein [Oscillospiraceae bacterium]|jgi:hypothetical protein|nr:DUF4926 domain-containing protein [Oscillospiraceae bacterium]